MSARGEEEEEEKVMAAPLDDDNNEEEDDEEEEVAAPPAKKPRVSRKRKFRVVYNAVFTMGDFGALSRCLKEGDWEDAQIKPLQKPWKQANAELKKKRVKNTKLEEVFTTLEDAETAAKAKMNELIAEYADESSGSTYSKEIERTLTKKELPSFEVLRCLKSALIPEVARDKDGCVLEGEEGCPDVRLKVWIQ